MCAKLQSVALAKYPAAFSGQVLLLPQKRRRPFSRAAPPRFLHACRMSALVNDAKKGWKSGEKLPSFLPCSHAKAAINARAPINNTAPHDIWLLEAN